MLLASATFMAALAPSIRAVVFKAQTTAATTYMNQIVTAVNASIGTVGETGCRRFRSSGGCNGPNVSLIVTDGDMPTRCVAATGCGGGVSSWNRLVNGTTIDFLERHIVTNNPGGNPANNYPIGNWKGAYMNAPIDPDPWGNRYMLNVEYMNNFPNSVWVLSAGPDETISTIFTAVWPVAVGGDDLAVRVEQ